MLGSPSSLNTHPRYLEPRPLDTSGPSTEPAQHGFRGVLTKPYRPEDLARVFREALAEAAEAKRARKGAEAPCPGSAVPLQEAASRVPHRCHPLPKPADGPSPELTIRQVPV